MQTQNKLSAFGIGVSDLEKSVEFYTKFLKLPEMYRYKLSYMDEVVVGHPGEAAIVLMHYTDGSSRNYTDNPVKLAFGVPDPAAVLASLREGGFQVIADARTYEDQKLIVGFAKDPDGYVIELFAPST